MAGEHALLNPSGLKIWSTCTPSARLAEKIEKVDSVYAAEGTTAHVLFQLLANRQLKRIREQNYKIQLEQIKKDIYYNNGMLKYMQAYLSYVMSIYAKALTIDSNALILIEHKLNLSKYIPGSFGTADVLIFCSGHIWFIDLKYGQGIRVEAEENHQLKAYALGAIELGRLFFSKIKNISLTIYQPRIDHIDTWETTVDKLIDWAENDLRAKALMAWKGEGELVAGEHCRFCAVKPTCRAVRDHNLNIAKKRFESPKELSEEEISNVVLGSDQVISWLKSVNEYALKEALKGKSFPDLKLITARSDRKITDTDKAVSILRKAGYSLEEIYKQPEIKGIGELEKLLGKDDFNYYLRSVVKKPYGAPSLVHKDKPGEPYDRMKKAIEKFSQV